MSTLVSLECGIASLFEPYCEDGKERLVYRIQNVLQNILDIAIVLNDDRAREHRSKGLRSKALISPSVTKLADIFNKLDYIPSRRFAVSCLTAR